MKNFIPGLRSIAWIAVTAIILVILKLYNPLTVERIQLTSFDTMLSTDSQVDSSKVVIVDINGTNVPRLEDLSRQLLARVIDRITELGASAVVVSIPLNAQDQRGDRELANALSHSNSVVGQTPNIQGKAPAPPRRNIEVMGGEPLDWLVKWPGATPPYKTLSGSAAGVGANVVLPDSDGVVRRMPLIVALSDQLYPTVSLEALLIATGQQSYQVKMNSAGIEKVRITNQPIINTDEHGRIWLRQNKNFTRYELSELQKKKINLKGKIVVLGVAIKSGDNLVITPNGPAWAHDVQAHAIQTILDGDSPVRSAFARSGELLVIVLIAFLLIFVLPRFPIWVLGFASISTLGIIIGGSFYAWQQWSQLWDMYSLVLCAVILYGHGLFTRMKPIR